MSRARAIYPDRGVEIILAKALQILRAYFPDQFVATISPRQTAKE